MAVNGSVSQPLRQTRDPSMDTWVRRVASLLLFAAAGFMLFEAGVVTTDDDLNALLLSLLAIVIMVGALPLSTRASEEDLLRLSGGDPPARDLKRMEQLLLSLQDDVSQLREDRDFYQSLYTERTGEPAALRSRIT